MKRSSGDKILILGLTLLLFVAFVVAPAFVRRLNAQTQPVGGLLGGVAGFVRAADGTVSAPSISFGSATNTGLYNVSGTPVMAVGGAAQARWQTNVYSLVSSEIVGWSSSDPTAAGIDVGITRVGIATIGIVNNTQSGKAALQTGGTATPLALPAGAIGWATSSTASVGNTGQGGRLVLVCGPTAGTGSWLLYTGTSNTPTVLANGVGSGLIGC